MKMNTKLALTNFTVFTLFQKLRQWHLDELLNPIRILLVVLQMSSMLLNHMEHPHMVFMSMLLEALDTVSINKMGILLHLNNLVMIYSTPLIITLQLIVISNPKVMTTVTFNYHMEHTKTSITILQVSTLSEIIPLL